MDRNKELLMISESLKSSDAVENVQMACRQILVDRIEAANIYDSEIRSVLTKIASGFGFGIDVKVIRNQTVIKTPISRSKVIGCGILGLIGLSIINCDNSFVRLLGGTMSIAGGLGAGYYLQNAKSEVQTNCETKIVQSASDILSNVDEVYLNFTKLFVYNQLEGKYISILRWLQEQWKEDLDDDFQKDIRKLLTKIKYEFVVFAPKLSAYFESNQADVERPMTTLPAIRNMTSEEIILNGHVIFPVIR